MKTVAINSVCGFGSTGRIALDISKSLSAESVQNWILYGVGQSDYRRGIKFGGKLNVRSHQIKTRLLGKHGFYSRWATSELVEKLEEIDPDIVHLHNLHGHYLNVEILFDYLKKSGKPVIWTLHDCWSFTGHCAHFDYIGCEKWKTGCYSCPQLREYPKSLILDRSKESYLDKERIFTGLSDLTIVTPSDWLLNLVEQSYLRQIPVRTIRNGIDLGVFKPVDTGFRKAYKIEDKFMILAVASYWNEKKGYSALMEISRKLKEDEVMVIVGVDGKQMEDLPLNIVGIERTASTADLAGIYSSADVFLNPTLEEVLGMVNVESLGCGTPVITFDSGGSPETVDEKTGIVVKRGDLDGMLDAVERVREKGKSHYSDCCIERATKEFDVKDKNRQYVELYREIQNRTNSKKVR